MVRPRLLKGFDCRTAHDSPRGGATAAERAAGAAFRAVRPRRRRGHSYPRTPVPPRRLAPTLLTRVAMLTQAPYKGLNSERRDTSRPLEGR
jgi:hypothetical protein